MESPNASNHEIVNLAQENMDPRNGEEGDEDAHLLPSHEFDFQEAESRRENTTKGVSSIRIWISGPQPPRKQNIEPFLPGLQSFPNRLVNRTWPTTQSKQRMLYAVVAAWTLIFTTLLSLSSFPTTTNTGESVVNLDCIDTLWKWKNECGLDGIDCGPFSNKTLAFRCPAGCKEVQVLNPRLVGATKVIFQPLVVGGGPKYRGDSFICASAIHAGVVSNVRGGCGRLARMGEGQDFESSQNNGISSIAFDSYFPLTFTVSRDYSNVQCGTGELRGILLLVSILFTGILSIFGPSGRREFLITFVAIFIHVGMVSDPPGASTHNSSTFPDHLSKLAEHLLPALFCAVVIYKPIVAKTVTNLQAPFEKTLLWLGGFWFGALSNLTFDWIPISRLRSHDLEQQPGAKLALAVIILLVVAIVAQQSYSLWLEGRLVRYLGLYGLFITAILICLVIPGVEFRLHHYVLALLLLPGTSIQTRPSLLYQGILLGLFVNGVARWGFASVLETPDSLRSDGAFGSLVPSIAASATPAAAAATTAANADTLVSTNISFTWAPPPAGSAVDGISVLVNDVERYRSYFAEDHDLPNSESAGFTWSRAADMSLPEYFRFGFVREGVALDYSGAGVWYANGTWAVGSGM